MVEIVKWKLESGPVGDHGTRVGYYYIDRNRRAIQIDTYPKHSDKTGPRGGKDQAQTTVIREKHLRELRDIINQVLNE